jgi:3'-phosphoadenosine 5'-phosphosulfate sulfotransferase (PAPS reductase)/FAD synthetase
MPLDKKIRYTDAVITDWYESHKGQVYIALSGGKDSTAMIHLVRKQYPEVPAVFCDTGLEFPEIRKFVKTFKNVTWLRPKMNYRNIIDKYGWPVISKENAEKIYEIRHTKSEKLRNKRMYGVKGRKLVFGKLPDKWHYLIKAPFEISGKCCYVMKKEPSHRYEKETGRVPFLGTKVGDSRWRKNLYMRTGCNAYDLKWKRSTPLAFWSDGDVWKYLKILKIPTSSIYDMGYESTGCIFCAFGAHLERPPNRFQRLAKTHPHLYHRCMDKLGMREVLEYIGVPLEEGEQLELGYRNNNPTTPPPTQP